MTKRNFQNIFLITGLVLSTVMLLPQARDFILFFAGVILHKQTNYYDYNMLRLFIIAFCFITAFIYCLLFTNATETSWLSPKKATIIICGVFSVLYLFFILYNTGWMINDNREFITTIAKHKLRTIHTENGRFWNQYEYNILLLTPFWNNIFSYYVINAIEYIVFTLFEFLIIKELFNSKKIPDNIITFIVISFLHVSIHALYCQIFNDIIYGEKLLVTLTLIATYFLLQAEKNDKLLNYIIPTICFVLSTYLKEPVFGTLIVLAFSIFIIYHKRLSKNKLIFCILLLINAITYIILYYFFSYSKATSFYKNGEVHGSPFSILLAFFIGNPFTILITILTVIKVIVFVKEFHSEKKTLSITDCLLFSGFAYFFAMYLLKMNTDTYLYPCYGFALTSFIIDISKFFSGLNDKLKKVSLPLCALLLLPACYLGYYDLSRIHYCRKNDSKIIDFVLDHLNNNGNLYWYTGYIESPWQRQILRDYIIYYMNDEEFNFIDTNKIPDNLKSNDLLIYTDTISYTEEIPEYIQEIDNFKDHFYMYKLKE